MIYERVQHDDAIKQGDIFQKIPRVDFSLSTLTTIDDDAPRITSWRTVLETTGSSTSITAVVPIEPVDAIVITQNCDATHGQYIYLCEIVNFIEATGGQAAKNAKGWQSLIVRFARTNPRLFYLPSDSNFGFVDRGMADFRVILRVPRTDLEQMKDLRPARLNEVATEHLREALGHYFRRFAYNEWYPLDKEEFQAYSEQFAESIEPYHWQR